MKNPRPELLQTVMCRNRDICCIYHLAGDCWFAHSEEELRCAHYARTGICPLAPNCSRRHVLVDIPPETTIVQWGRRPFQVDVPYVITLPLYPLPDVFNQFVPVRPVDVRHKRCEAVKYFRSLFKRLQISHADLAGGKDKYTGILHEMQQVEELFGIIDLVSYKLEGVWFEPGDKEDMFKLTVPGLAENRPSVLRGDNVHVFVHRTRQWLGGRVHFVNVDALVISLPHKFTDLLTRNRIQEIVVDVCFTMTRTQERVRHSAIDHGVFFDVPTCSAITTVNFAGDGTSRVKYPSPLNDEQQKLISMVTVSQGPRAVLLWGPPGTGKTTTVVAAIAETLGRVPNAKILVCTPSNEAADVVVERLLTFATQPEQCPRLVAALTPQLLIRVNGMMRQEKSIPSGLVPFSFPDKMGGFRLPSVDEVAAANVVVCTLMTSSKLRAIGIADDHFTHLFVDEAGHATEAEFMIATMVCKNAARCVLAGDHKQLGSMVRAPPAIDAGMGISPLERLMNEEQLAGQRIMLTHNYRSVNSMIDVINAVYGDRLVATRGPLPTGFNLPIGQSSVPVSPKHPLLFIHHKGFEARENDSPSWMNVSEAHILVDIAMFLWKNHRIQPEDITFLSPYRKQVKKIDSILFHKLQGDCEVKRDARERPIVPFKVSTVEAFQGRESRVVLLSCVRNGRTDTVDSDVRFGIGFLKQPQRANVAMSRARDLLVVAGNVELLARDDLWRSYLERLLLKPPGVVVDASRSGCSPTPMTEIPKDWLRQPPLAQRQVEDTVDIVTSANEERAFERHL